MIRIKLEIKSGLEAVLGLNELNAKQSSIIEKRRRRKSVSGRGSNGARKTIKNEDILESEESLKKVM